MKFIFTVTLLFAFSVSFSQWTRIDKIPDTDIQGLYKDDTALYASGKNKVYISKDKGKTWDSTTVIPLVNGIDAVTIFKNELYVASFNRGVYKTANEGATWQNITQGILPFVSAFREWQGNLYAATLGGSMYKLEPVARNTWISFSVGLSSLSVNLTTLSSNTHTLLAGTLGNAIFDRLPENTTQWDERFIFPGGAPGGGIYDIINAHDTLFMVNHTTFYFSTDNGVNWTKIGNQFLSTYHNLVNAKEALIDARNTFDGFTNNTTFLYLKKDSFAKAFVPFSSVIDRFSYTMEILDNKLWDATTHGLFYMELSDLNGISSPDDDNVPGGGGNGGGGNGGGGNGGGGNGGGGNGGGGNGGGGVTTYPFAVGVVYPNPATGDANISLSLDTLRYVSASLYDVNGKRVSVINGRQQLPAGPTILTFKMGALKSGIYFLRLQVGNKVFTRKIVHTNR